MIGVRFTFDDSKVGDHFLSTILDKIDVANFTWNMYSDDIYLVPCKGNDYLFNSHIVDGPTFYKNITTLNYVVIMSNLQAFPNVESVRDLHTYSDYVKSECQMLVAVTDNQFVEVLSKNEQAVKQVYQNALQNAFSRIAIIEELEDSTLLTDI